MQYSSTCINFAIYSQTLPIFADNMEALFDVWIMGDKFCHEIKHSLIALKDQSRVTKKPFPYLFNYYNIRFFNHYNSSSTRNALAHIINSVIGALNTFHWLPAYLVIIPDRDLLDSISHFEYGISKCCMYASTYSLGIHPEHAHCNAT